MQLTTNFTSTLGRGRPILRIQLTLLYTGVFLGVLAVAALAAGVLYGQTRTPAPDGSNGDGFGVANRVFDVSAAAIGLAIAVAALVGAWWLAGKFLRTLRTMTATAQEISATNLHRRLDLHGANDELTELGKTLDDLFDRLESSFESQRRFVANASHELRTPLAGQRTVLQVALANPTATIVDLREACQEVLQLGDQQEQLIDALLTLATSERGIEKWEQFDLTQLTETILLSRQGEVERRSIHLVTVFNSAPIVGDPRLIERLVTNLVDNAIGHNVPSGSVEITTSTSGSHATLMVSNTGPTIPQADLDRLFEPFQQTGTGRVREADGHGLGLAIVQAIAKTHAATISAHAHNTGGLEIQIRFNTSTP
jgi:signal transduction histidine kinase